MNLEVIFLGLKIMCNVLGGQEITVPQWERLLATRKRKMQQEAEVARLTSIMKSMAGFLVHLTQVDDSNSKEIEVCLRTMADFREEREIGRKNLEFIIKMKSGFVEAILDPLQGDYADVVLLPCSLIEDFNKVVLYEANTKARVSFFFFIFLHFFRFRTLLWLFDCFITFCCKQNLHTCLFTDFNRFFE
uniref:Uncharacterized protein n=2 Tax=Physcomitrium patens TaxID=3218 RepID=A0A2K1KB32_PHYPA|nr:hypothetical protein PHYPA_010162 [Physcomitrium patens]